MANLENVLANRQLQLPVGSVGALPYRMPQQQPTVNWMQKQYGPSFGTGNPLTPPQGQPGQNPSTSTAPPTGSTSMTPPSPPPGLPGAQPPTPGPQPGGMLSSMMKPPMQYGQPPNGMTNL